MGTGKAGQFGNWPADDVALSPPSERERLAAAMAESCAEVGYRATTVTSILRRTGLSRETFASHFADKSACALAAVDEILAEVTQAAAGAHSPGLNDWQRLLTSTLAVLELMAARPSYARLALLEARHSMPTEAYERYRAGIRVLLAMLERARLYAAAGAPPSASRGAIGSAEALIRRELIAGRAERLPELLPDITYGAVVPFLDQQEALRYAGLAKELINDGG